jgi:hypothetical protein
VCRTEHIYFVPVFHQPFCKSLIVLEVSNILVLIWEFLQVVLTLDCYGVEDIRGISNGYRGFFDENLHDIPVCSNTLPFNSLNYSDSFT